MLLQVHSTYPNLNIIKFNVVIIGASYIIYLYGGNKYVIAFN